MRVLFLTKYGNRAASSRLRFLQYLPYLEQRGVQCQVEPLFDDEYVARRFSGGSISIDYLVKRYWRRLQAVLSSRKFDVAVLQYEAFPYIPAWLESLVGSSVPYVLDLDDAIFHGYDSHARSIVRFALGDKIRKLVRNAAYVLAGSPYLVDYARRENGNVDWVPTCVDLRRFQLKQWEETNVTPFTIGWIGAPSSVQFAIEAIPAVRELATRRPVQLVYVGSGPVSYEGVTPEVREWSEETEVSEMLRFDVGIMPLPDTPWTRGKCSFKLIQYMACGLPVVASPVGMNCEVVTNGVNGFLAASTVEWLQALEAMAGDVSLRRRLGSEGRRLVERAMTTEVGGGKLFSAITAAANAPVERISAKS